MFEVFPSMISGKRPHTKSRHGCVQCRRRKVKCCETAPICKRCQLRGEPCSLQDSKSLSDLVNQDLKTHSVDTNHNVSRRRKTLDYDSILGQGGNIIAPLRSHSSEESQTIPTSSRTYASASSYSYSSSESLVGHFGSHQSTLPDQDEESQLPVACLPYIHHYLLSTAHSIIFLPTTLETWTEIVPQLAYSNKFLLHETIAISALHKAYLCALNCLDDTESLDQLIYHLNVAGEHQARAVELYIPKLAEASPDICIALLSFNITFSIAPFGWQVVMCLKRELQSTRTAKQRIVENDVSEQEMNIDGGPEVEYSSSAGSTSTKATMNLHDRTYLAAFLESLSILRGTHVILNEYWPWIEGFEIGNIFTFPDLESLDEISLAAQQSLGWMRIECRSLLLEEDRTLFDAEIACLHRMAKIAANPTKFVNQGSVMHYPATMSQRTISGLKTQETLPLVMLSFWVACFGIAIEKNSGRWWGKGWSKGLIGEILEILEQKAQASVDIDNKSGFMHWAQAMDWPMQSFL